MTRVNNPLCTGKIGSEDWAGKMAVKFPANQFAGQNPPAVKSAAISAALEEAA